jgi:hypothetical protein
MSALHATVIEAFKIMGWQYRIVPEIEVVECAFEAHHSRILTHAQTHGEAGIVTVVSNSTVIVPSSHILAVSELIMRSNRELSLGNFEMDWDTGQVMFRVANVFGRNRADTRIIAGLVHTAVAEMDRMTAYLLELTRASELELPVFSIPGLLAREDLLPEPPKA